MSFIDLIKHLFLPHESNNHKPRLLHPQAFLFYIVFFVFLSFGGRLVYRLAPNILGIATNISVNDLLSFTNQKRKEAGLSPLSLNSKLSQAASLKASDMFNENYWAHYSPKGKSPWDFIISSGYTYTVAGENLAKDFDDSNGVVEAWMSSSSHKDNILKPDYNDIGFAVVNGKINGQDTTLVVQMFGTTPQPEANETNVVSDIQNTSEIQPTTSPNQFTGSNLLIAGVRNKPLIDLNILNKSISLILLGILIIIMTLDAFLIWRRKTFRVSGHNIAHVIFFVGLGMAIFVASRGSIL